MRRAVVLAWLCFERLPWVPLSEDYLGPAILMYSMLLISSWSLPLRKLWYGGWHWFLLFGFGDRAGRFPCKDRAIEGCQHTSIVLVFGLQTQYWGHYWLSGPIYWVLVQFSLALVRQHAGSCTCLVGYLQKSTQWLRLQFRLPNILIQSWSLQLTVCMLIWPGRVHISGYSVIHCWHRESWGSCIHTWVTHCLPF